MRAGHVPAVGLRANVVLPKHNASQTECLLMAHRGGRHLDCPSSLSGHCGHGPIFIAQRSVANDPLRKFDRFASCKVPESLLVPPIVIRSPRRRSIASRLGGISIHSVLAVLDDTWGARIPARSGLVGCTNQMAHLWLAVQLEPMNQFLLLAIGMSHPLVLT
jgi:hypothetical protein